METDFTRPGFLSSYFDAMKERAHTEGWRAVVPVWLIISAAVAAGMVYYLPDELWSDKVNWQVIVAIYAALVTINGLLLALSWSAFARIHELLVSSAEFAVFLRRAKLFNHYLFYIDWVQAAQLLALLVSAGAMFTSIVQQIPLWCHRAILAASIAVTIYAIRYAVNAVTITHDLVWQRAIFEEQELTNRGRVVALGRQPQDGDASR